MECCCWSGVCVCDVCVCFVCDSTCDVVRFSGVVVLLCVSVCVFVLMCVFRLCIIVWSNLCLVCCSSMFVRASFC